MRQTSFLYKEFQEEEARFEVRVWSWVWSSLYLLCGFQQVAEPILQDNEDAMSPAFGNCKALWKYWLLAIIVLYIIVLILLLGFSFQGLVFLQQIY